jgi:hypothetical protein
MYLTFLKITGMFLGVFGWSTKELALARRIRRTRKKRSGWKHPLDVNRNHRRCQKRRRSESVRARRACAALRELELQLELATWQLHYGWSGSHSKAGRPALQGEPPAKSRTVPGYSVAATS